ncbi:hypothetical protein SCUP234_03224 [Seiridium cupressi]
MRTPDVELYCAAAYRMYTIRDAHSNQNIRSLSQALNSIGPHLNTTGPRDYIYAYISFLEGRDRSSIQVDYKKSLQALWQEIVTSILKSDDKDHLVIYQNFSPNTNNPKRRSWVPDPATQGYDNRVNGDDFVRPPLWRDVHPVTFTWTGKQIKLRGVIFDVIHETHKVRRQPNEYAINCVEMWKASEFVGTALERLPPSHYPPQFEEYLGHFQSHPIFEVDCGIHDGDWARNRQSLECFDEVRRPRGTRTIRSRVWSRRRKILRRGDSKCPAIFISSDRREASGKEVAHDEHLADCI